MKRYGVWIVFALLLAAALPVTARAESFEGKEGLYVTFTAAKEVESNFTASDFTDSISALQPGDEITFSVAVSNRHPETVDWYMSNDVIHSLEDRKAAAAGGAYTYVLTYEAPGRDPRVLYNSDAVGGDEINAAGEGMHKATDALKDFFYLDTQANGAGGTVTLYVALDGETQGNDYQNTKGDLLMRFAVELKDSDEPPVKTGDETDLMPYYGLMAGTGALLLFLAAAGVRLRRKTTREDEA